MVIGAKFQPGDVVGLITAIDAPPFVVVAVTEWMDGITYTIRSGGSEMEGLFGAELTSMTQDGLPLNVEGFGPGEGLTGTVDEGGSDE